MAMDRFLGTGVGNVQAQRFQFQYNPGQMRFTRELHYGDLGTPGTDVPTTYFIRAAPDSLTFTLQFEAKLPNSISEAKAYKEKGIYPSVYSLLALTYANETLRPDLAAGFFQPRRPPRLIFSLGKPLAIPVFLRHVEISFEEWNPEMLPNRGKAEVSLITQGLTSVMMNWLQEVNTHADDHMQSLTGSPTQSRIEARIS